MQIIIWLYIGCLIILSFYGLHRLYMVAYLMAAGRKSVTGSALTNLPKVCVQLPIYNEPQVARRVLKAAAALDYPADRLEIQVLDDSGDETVRIIESETSRLKAEGVRVSHIRRNERFGFKAGALQNGMNLTDAEYFAVFDADFIPDRDFLRKTLPYFNSSGVGMVQARWGHLNRNQSFLTRAQAVLLDGHFMIEHAFRFTSGALFNFNGTAGVWRREAIESAGRWSGDTLTEDLDLSYRAQMKGWRFVYLKDVICPAELPEDIDAFKSQQYRWTKGSAQVFKKLAGKIAVSSMTPRQKIEAFFHLSANICYVLVSIVALLFPLTAYWRSLHPFPFGFWLEGFVLIATFFSLLIFYASSQLWQGRKVVIWELTGAVTLALGMMLHCAGAALSGLFGRRGEFVRTPKRGLCCESAVKLPVLSERLTKNAVAGIVSIHIKEFIVGAYLLCGLLVLSLKGNISVLPFGILLIMGYGQVLLAALNSRQ